MRRWRLCWAVWIKLPPDRRVTKNSPNQTAGVGRSWENSARFSMTTLLIGWTKVPTARLRRGVGRNFHKGVCFFNYGKPRCATIYFWRKLIIYIYIYCGMAHSCFLNISPLNFLKMFVSNWSSSTDSSSHLWFIRWSQPNLTMKSQPEERLRLDMAILAMLTMTINHQYSLAFLNNIYSFPWVE